MYFLRRIPESRRSRRERGGPRRSSKFQQPTSRQTSNSKIQAKASSTTERGQPCPRGLVRTIEFGRTRLSALRSSFEKVRRIGKASSPRPSPPQEEREKTVRKPRVVGAPSSHLRKTKDAIGCPTPR